MGEEFNEELVATAMQIIMNAGDARLSVKDALSYAKAFDFTEAENKMEEEANGKKYEYSMLFAHAQDTLMTIMSEIQLAEQMIDILKIISHK